MTAHEIHALAGAYAVGAVDDLERARFEEHLAVCAECRAEVRSLQDTTLLLSEVTPVAPPAAMRAKLLSDIKKVRPLPPAVARIERRRPRRWTNLVAAAAVLGVLGGAAVVTSELRDDSAGITPVPASQILTAADVQHWNTEFKSGASATLYRSESVGRAVLVARSMGRAPEGKTYQLWLLKDGTMVPDVLMRGGEEMATVLLRGNANDASGVGITLEPEDGSQVPTGEPIAEFNFSQKQA